MRVKFLQWISHGSYIGYHMDFFFSWQKYAPSLQNITGEPFLAHHAGIWTIIPAYPLLFHDCLCGKLSKFAFIMNKLIIPEFFLVLKISWCQKICHFHFWPAGPSSAKSCGSTIKVLGLGPQDLWPFCDWKNYFDFLNVE